MVITDIKFMVITDYTKKLKYLDLYNIPFATFYPAYLAHTRCRFLSDSHCLKDISIEVCLVVHWQTPLKIKDVRPDYLY